MQQALALAQKGLFTTHPNPRVGCVIIKNGELAGEGWHEAAGKAHAEILALEQAGPLAKGATLYVTLEPCAHFGRTPPCDEALIQAGIAKVVISTLDPNPLVNGKGMAHLRQANIEVAVGLLEKEAKLLNKGFFKRIIQGLPYVTCKMAMSLDGKTALANGQSQWITGPEVKQAVMQLRAQSSAIITGIGTVLQDDPQLNVRGIETPRQPLRVIVDSHLRISQNAKILQSSPTLIVTTTSAPQKIPGAEIVVLPKDAKGQVDCLALLQYLATEHHINEVLLEAGPTLSGAFLKQKLIDEIIIFMAPKLLGHSALSLFELPANQSLQDCMQLDIASITPIGQDWKIHVLRHH